MGLDPKQFMDCAIIPVLDKMACVLELPFSNINAYQLILGTFCAESQLKYLRQINGPARGLGQCEEATYDDICNYVRRKDKEFLAKVVYCVYGQHYRDLPSYEYLATDLRLQVVIARLHYWRIEEPIPDTLFAQAEYYKKYYNTYEGKATISHYINSFPPNMHL